MNTFHVERVRAVELAKRLLEKLAAIDTLMADHWRGGAQHVAEQLAAARTLINDVIPLPNLAERPDDTGISGESVRRIVRNSYFLLFDYLFRLEYGPETPDDADDRIGRMFLAVAIDIDHLLATRTLRVLQ